MGKKLSNEELRRVCDLQRAGIPLNEQVVEDLKRASRGLSLFQTGTPVENGVFELAHGGWEFMASIAMCNESDRVMYVTQHCLHVSWCEPNFRWLENPRRKSPREYSYSFSREQAGFEPEVVLNHRLGKNGRLNPGESFEGLLLGVGQASIPDEFRDRQRFLAQLTIFDGRGDRYKLELELWVYRKGRIQDEKRIRDRFDSRISHVRSAS